MDSVTGLQAQVSVLSELPSTSGITVGFLFASLNVTLYLSLWRVSVGWTLILPQGPPKLRDCRQLWDQHTAVTRVYRAWGTSLAEPLVGNLVLYARNLSAAFERR